MDRRTTMWVLVVFFGGTVLFGGLRRLTEGEPTAVVVGVQVGALVAVFLAVAVLARRLR